MPTTWDDLLEVALGELQLTPDTFFDMCPRELWAAHSGYTKRIETQQRIAFEAARFSARAIVQAWAKKGSKIKLEDIAKFPWDTDGHGRKRTDGGFLSYDSVSAFFSLISKPEQPNGEQ